MLSPTYRLAINGTTIDANQAPATSSVVGLVLRLDMDTPADQLKLTLGRVDGVPVTWGDDLTLELGKDLLSERQKNQFVKRFYKQMQRCVSAPRRARSCPRAVRQPVTGWPRLQPNVSIEGPVQFQLV